MRRKYKSKRKRKLNKELEVSRKKLIAKNKFNNEFVDGFEPEKEGVLSPRLAVGKATA
jgi:hypothetical protein